MTARASMSDSLDAIEYLAQMLMVRLENPPKDLEASFIWAVHQIHDRARDARKALDDHDCRARVEAADKRATVAEAAE